MVLNNSKQGIFHSLNQEIGTIEFTVNPLPKLKNCVHHDLTDLFLEAMKSSKEKFNAFGISKLSIAEEFRENMKSNAFIN